ncbi:MAG: acetate uptake transporter [Candidatus Bathyarchaeia archaeon]
MNNKLANPAPLGLMGFGMTTVLLNLHNAGLIDRSGMGVILSMGIFYGGLAQIFAGMWEIKRGNTLGTTAFSSFGLFWISLVAIKIFPVLGWFEAPSPNAVAAYLTVWGLFTALMTISTFKVNRTLQLVFVTLTLLFSLLAIGEVVTGMNDVVGNIITTVAGYEGIFCGFSAIYLATAEVVNEIYGKTIFPV